ncbi:hypothetical protein DM02DRAFT_565973 [Periconia macrospinosa]|uniref:DUF7492 domain-containing protein n=1 Tax=Periconia macrospinosa TaxID=97972 RepID=A0A2V1DMW8_9PLEO|nr:hypothetical protein DM02DRAFT_565973 [Periconia macrospinosa]
MIFTLFSLILPTAYAHSWVERAFVVRNGIMTGQPGYPRGNVQRAPTFRDQDMTYRLPPAGRIPNKVSPEDHVCMVSQRSLNYTQDSPMLLAQANDEVVLMYQENGHVTRIEEDVGHGRNGGTVMVIGTSNSTFANTFQSVVSPANNYTKTLRVGSFDDGWCYQANETPKSRYRQMQPQRPHLESEGINLWCGQTVRLPSTLRPGDIYTLYWIWFFDGVGFEERYTTCLDVRITG